EARFRPEAARLFSSDDIAVIGPGITFGGEVAAVSYPGGHWRHVVKLGDHEIMADAERAFEPGARVAVFVPAEALFLFGSPEAASASPISRAPSGKVHA
ncbi:TOBE domain-containing protein, partial [Neorhizobium sp. BETTINA12A]|uniref:TOBE domain-containing protein n=1 Tax=Neorhizobium sp. BETTINA12A TaxID=2908924 RepID=UPI001FF31333